MSFLLLSPFVPLARSLESNLVPCHYSLAFHSVSASLDHHYPTRCLPFFVLQRTTKIERLEENFAAANVKLSSVEEARVRAVLDGAMFGENYSVEHTFAMCADTPLPE